MIWRKHRRKWLWPISRNIPAFVWCHWGKQQSSKPVSLRRFKMGTCWSQVRNQQEYHRMKFHITWLLPRSEDKQLHQLSHEACIQLEDLLQKCVERDQRNVGTPLWSTLMYWLNLLNFKNMHFQVYSSIHWTQSRWRYDKCPQLIANYAKEICMGRHKQCTHKTC